jgi:hypothetical protein
MDNPPAGSKKLCFVIGPIGEPGSQTRIHANWLLKEIIQPVFAENFPDFRVERADEITAPGSINSQVINRLWDAPLVIADMSQHNANAFYELAIRHIVRLPTIHMIHSADKIPFDVAPYRAISFSWAEAEHLKEARAALKSTVEEVTKPEFVVENPITHARGVIEFEQHASPGEKVLADEIAALQRRVGVLEEDQPVGSNPDAVVPEAVLLPGARRIHGDTELAALRRLRGDAEPPNLIIRRPRPGTGG